MNERKSRRWNVLAPDHAVVKSIAAGCKVSSLVARLLYNRGARDSAAAARFLEMSLQNMYPPRLLADLPKGVARVADAIVRDETICIYGDYDVDGITSSAVFSRFLGALGVKFFVYIPNRFEEGYGLNGDSLKEIAARGATVVVTVDCGVTAAAEALLCRELGIDLVITDHHTVPAQLPDAYAVINPHRPDDAFPFKELAGVGVAFNFVTALREELRVAGYFKSRPEPALRPYLALVALGTIADVMPLADENRLFVKYGLAEINRGSYVGVDELVAYAVDKGKRVTSGKLAFKVCPMLNAAGRLESAMTALTVLTTEDAGVAKSIAAGLNAKNEERKAIEDEIVKEAIAMLESVDEATQGIVLAAETWHEGVIGIVASRIAERFHRPTFIVTRDGEGRAKGSGRSIRGVSLIEMLNDSKHILTRYGGHAYAAGAGLPWEAIPAFVKSFDESARKVVTGEPPVLEIDAVMEAGQVSLQAVDDIAALEPYGNSNKEPVFALCGARVVKESVLKDAHLKLTVEKEGKTFECIKFRDVALPGKEATVDIAFVPERNVWNGRESLSLLVKDIQRVAAP